MMNRLFVQAILKFLLGLLTFSFLLFIPAGTLYYWNAWLLIGLLFIPMFFAGIFLMIKNPDLLQKRLRLKENEKDQKTVIKLTALMFIVGLILAGLNFRFKWFILPDWITFSAVVVFLIAYLMYAEVLRENVYLSRTVEVQENQKVIDTGLYGIIRHPMYGITIVLFLCMPLILGSPISFLIFLVYPFIISKRITNEEIVLEKGLEGYSEYKKKVPYKLFPFLW